MAIFLFQSQKIFLWRADILYQAFAQPEFLQQMFFFIGAVGKLQGWYGYQKKLRCYLESRNGNFLKIEKFSKQRGAFYINLIFAGLKQVTGVFWVSKDASWGVETEKFKQLKFLKQRVYFLHKRNFWRLKETCKGVMDINGSVLERRLSIGYAC